MTIRFTVLALTLALCAAGGQFLSKKGAKEGVLGKVDAQGYFESCNGLKVRPADYAGYEVREVRDSCPRASVQDIEAYGEEQETLKKLFGHY